MQRKRLVFATPAFLKFISAAICLSVHPSAESNSIRRQASPNSPSRRFRSSISERSASRCRIRVSAAWSAAGGPVLGGLALFYTTAMVVVGVSFRRYLARQPKPFDATLHEIREDRACIRSES